MTTSPLRLVTGGNDNDLPPIERYEIHMRAAGLSARWIDDSLALLHQIERFADASIEHVPALTIQRFLGRDGLAQSTRYTYFGYAIAFFRWYEQHGGHNPMLGMRRPRMPRSEPRPVTDDQLQRLLATNMHKRTRVMILLAALAGLRVHEIAKVRGEDVDLIGRTLHVTGKGGHKASIPLHPLLIEAGYQLPRTGWWFPANSTREGHMHGRSVGSVIGLAMRRADIPSTAHALRHYFGTTLVSTGADLRTTQTLMRHASLQSTEIYTAVSDERRIDAIARLQPLGDGPVVAEVPTGTEVPSTALEAPADDLAELDWTPAVPCEYRDHRARSGSAENVVTWRNHAQCCGAAIDRGTQVMCADCTAEATGERWYCPRCDSGELPASNWIDRVAPL